MNRNEPEKRRGPDPGGETGGRGRTSGATDASGAGDRLRGAVILRRSGLRSWHLLAAVLVVALVAGAWSWARRRAHCLAMAAYHRSRMDQYRSIGSVVVGPADSPSFLDQQYRWGRWQAHKEAADAYEAAAKTPWVRSPEESPLLPDWPSPGPLRVPEDDVEVLDLPPTPPGTDTSPDPTRPRP